MNENLQLFFIFFVILSILLISGKSLIYLPRYRYVAWTKQYGGSGSARNPIIFIYPDPTIGLLSKIEMFTKITKYIF